MHLISSKDCSLNFDLSDKIASESIQFLGSMFLSFILTPSAEKFSRSVGETGANLLMHPSYWLTNFSKVFTNFGMDRSWIRSPMFFAASILFVAVPIGP